LGSRAHDAGCDPEHDADLQARGSGCAVALLEAVADFDDGVDRWDELAAKVRERVLHGRGGRRLDGAADDAVGLELLKSCGERLAGDPLEVVAQLVESARAVAQVPDDVWRPGAAEQRETLGQRALARRWCDTRWAVTDAGVGHGGQGIARLPG